jgi:hypothetical protein
MVHHADVGEVELRRSDDAPLRAPSVGGQPAVQQRVFEAREVRLTVVPDTLQSAAMFEKFTMSPSESAAASRKRENTGRLRTSPSAAISSYR